MVEDNRTCGRGQERGDRAPAEATGPPTRSRGEWVFRRRGGRRVVGPTGPFPSGSALSSAAREPGDMGAAALLFLVILALMPERQGHRW